MDEPGWLSQPPIGRRSAFWLHMGLARLLWRSELTLGLQVIDASASESLRGPQETPAIGCEAQTALSGRQVVQTAHRSPLFWAVSGVGLLGGLE
jgi:hypothetical protein